MPLAGLINLSSIATIPPNNASFLGTAATDDWVELNASIFYNSNVLTSKNEMMSNYWVPGLSVESNLTIRVDDSNNGIEQLKRVGSGIEGFNTTYTFLAPGNYSDRTDSVMVYATNGDDFIVLPQSTSSYSRASGGDGNDRLIGGEGVNVFSGGPGSNRLEGRGGGDYYQARTKYNANDTIFDNGTDNGIDRLQIYLDTTTGWNWGFERVEEDLKGFVLDQSGRYDFTVKGQYNASNYWQGLESVILYSPGSSDVFRGFNLKTESTNSGAFGIAGTSLGETFDTNALLLGPEKQFIRVWGNGGNDTLIRSNKDDIFHFFRGDEGIDTVIYSKARADYTITKPGNAVEVKSKAAKSETSADVLQTTERLKFSDLSIAYDVVGDGHAGTVAKILGSVFGASAVSSKEYVGIGLGLLDGGVAFSALVDLALNVALGDTRSNTTVVDLLYKNLVGAPPSSTERKNLVDLIDSGQHTQVSLGVFAANLPLNAQNVNLVGLAQTGLEFV